MLKRCDECRNASNKNKKQFELSSTGQLQIENHKSNNK